MALVLDATVGGPNSNSYITVEEAEDYFEGRLHSTNWLNAIPTEKTAALVMATTLLDDWIDWKGTKADLIEDQALRWPRYNAEHRDGEWFDSDIIPGFLKRAVCEEAIFLLGKDPTAAPDTQGFSSLRVASLALTVDKYDRDKDTSIPDYVKSIVEPYGIIRSSAGGGVVRVERT